MIGKNIQFYRDLRKLNGKELAGLVGCSIGALSHIEKGSRKPSMEMLYKIADALDVSVINLVMDQQELQRFYFDDEVKSYLPGSEVLARVIETLKVDSQIWANAKHIAIVDLGNYNKK